MDPKLIALLNVLKHGRPVEGLPWKTEGKAPVTPVKREDLADVPRPVTPVTREELGMLPTRPPSGPDDPFRLRPMSFSSPSEGPPAKGRLPTENAIAAALRGQSAPAYNEPGWVRASRGRYQGRAALPPPGTEGGMPGAAGPPGMGEYIPTAPGLPTGEGVLDVSRGTSMAPGARGYTDDPLVNAVIQVESGGRPNVPGAAGEIGPMQVLPSTGAQPGYGVTPAGDLSNPQENVRFGGDYLNAMIGTFGNVRDALIAFNMGPTATKAWIAQGKNDAALPASVRTYLERIRQYVPPALAGMI